MKLPFNIIQLLKEKSGNELRLPSDCEFLSLDIESKTGVRIGATTLKRLLGFAQDERMPSPAISAMPIGKSCLRSRTKETPTLMLQKRKSALLTYSLEPVSKLPICRTEW